MAFFSQITENAVNVILTAFFFRDILRKDIIGVERYDNLQLFRIPHTAPIYGGIYEKTEGFKIAVKIICRLRQESIHG